ASEAIASRLLAPKSVTAGSPLRRTANGDSAVVAPGRRAGPSSRLVLAVMPGAGVARRGGGAGSGARRGARGGALWRGGAGARSGTDRLRRRQRARRAGPAVLAADRLVELRRAEPDAGFEREPLRVQDRVAQLPAGEPAAHRDGLE